MIFKNTIDIIGRQTVPVGKVVHQLPLDLLFTIEIINAPPMRTYPDSFIAILIQAGNGNTRRYFRRLYKTVCLRIIFIQRIAGSYKYPAGGRAQQAGDKIAPEVPRTAPCGIMLTQLTRFDIQHVQSMLMRTYPEI